VSDKNKMHKKSIILEDYDGFTLIELISVMILTGVVSSLIIGHVSDHEAEIIREAEIIQSHVRYVHYLSLSSGDVHAWRMRFTEDGYQIEKDGQSDAISLPGERDRSDKHNFEEGITMTSDAFTLSFNRWGQPDTTPLQMIISDGRHSRTLRISPETGFISE